MCYNYANILSIIINWINDQSSTKLFRVHAIHTLLPPVLLGPEHQLIKSLQGMPVSRIIHQFITSQNVGLTEPLRKLRVLHGRPLHRHLQLILAAINQETDKVEYGKVQQNDQKNERRLAQNDYVVEDPVKSRVENSLTRSHQRRSS